MIQPRGTLHLTGASQRLLMRLLLCSNCLSTGRARGKQLFNDSSATQIISHEAYLRIVACWQLGGWRKSRPVRIQSLRNQVRVPSRSAQFMQINIRCDTLECGGVWFLIPGALLGGSASGDAANKV